MSDNLVITMLNQIGQKLDSFDRLTTYSSYYTIIDSYIPQLSPAEVEAALVLAVKIKQATARSEHADPATAPTSTPQDTPTSTTPHLSHPVHDQHPKQPAQSASKENSPSKHIAGSPKRIAMTDEDRLIIDQLRQLGYTPEEISRLVNARSKHWAKNIIYSHATTSYESELFTLRHLDLENLPTAPARPKLVKRQLGQTNDTPQHTSDPVDTIEDSIPDEPEEPA